MILQLLHVEVVQEHDISDGLICIQIKFLCFVSKQEQMSVLNKILLILWYSLNGDYFFLVHNIFFKIFMLISLLYIVLNWNF